MGLRDGQIGRGLDFQRLALYRQRQMVRLPPRGGLIGVTVSDQTRKRLTLVTQAVCPRIQARIDRMAEFFGQHQFDRACAGAGLDPVGVQIDHTLTAETAFGKGPEHVLQLGRAQQLHLDGAAALRDIGQQAIESCQPLRRRLCIGTSALEDLVELSFRLGLQQVVADQFARIGLRLQQRGWSGRIGQAEQVFRHSRLARWRIGLLPVEHRAGHIGHGRAVKHETRLQRHQATAAAGQCGVFLWALVDGGLAHRLLLLAPGGRCSVNRSKKVTALRGA